MKAILYKRDDDFYSLKVDGIVMATSNGMLVDYRLSKQNCDSLFGAVDAEKLAQMDIHNVKPINPHPHSYFSGFIRGFNKAMELNRFTLEDMRMAMTYGIVQEGTGFEGIHSVDDLFDLILKKVSQPTEIDVVIVMEEVIIGQCDCECHSNTSIMHFMACCNPKIFTEPKLDENGCLILKRKI